jgi:hypothetical protein
VAAGRRAVGGSLSVALFPLPKTRLPQQRLGQLKVRACFLADALMAAVVVPGVMIRARALGMRKRKTGAPPRKINLLVFYT